MNNWKRNAVVATVLLFVCAGIYLNWSYNQRAQAEDLTNTIDVAALQNGNYEQNLLDAAQEGLEQVDSIDPEAVAETFAGIRLSRQESRESAIELLQETISYAAEDDAEAVGIAETSLEELLTTALMEAQIESMVVAKGYTDCVAYISDEQISLAVAAPEAGLQDTDVALLADLVVSQTDYDLSAIRIIEVGKH